jgi:hypothetical protein
MNIKRSATKKSKRNNQAAVLKLTTFPFIEASEASVYNITGKHWHYPPLTFENL